MKTTLERQRRRRAKVDALVAAMTKGDDPISAADAALMTGEQWDQAGQAAGVKLPVGPETREQVHAILSAREAVAASFNIPPRKSTIERAAFAQYWKEKGHFGVNPEDVARLAWSAGVAWKAQA